MASVFPTEGIDIILGLLPKGGSSLKVLYLGLFTSQTASTVPAQTAVLASQSGVTEASGTNYMRAAVADNQWGDFADVAGGRKTTTVSVLLFPTVGAPGWGTVNGFFLADRPTGGRAVYYSNFDDGEAIITGPNDRIAVRPSITLRNP